MKSNNNSGQLEGPKLRTQSILKKIITLNTQKNEKLVQVTRELRLCYD